MSTLAVTVRDVASELLLSTASRLVLEVRGVKGRGKGEGSFADWDRGGF